MSAPVQFSLQKKTRKKKSSVRPRPAFGEEDDDRHKHEKSFIEKRAEPLVIPNTGNRWQLGGHHHDAVGSTDAAAAAVMSAEDLAAAQALQVQSDETSSARRGQNNPQKLVVQAAANTNQKKTPMDETQQYKADLEKLPDNVPIDSDVYQAVPIAEFGAALLRGMGWKEESSKANGNNEEQPTTSMPRPHRLGLGAIPKMPENDQLFLLGGKRKSRRPDQFKHQQALKEQQQQFAKEREERIKADKQRTLQNGSLVWIRQRRVRVVQLVGVPGLNRVKVQYENERETAIVKRGELGELVSREELEERPFRERKLRDQQDDRQRGKDEEKRTDDKDGSSRKGVSDGRRKDIKREESDERGRRESDDERKRRRDSDRKERRRDEDDRKKRRREQEKTRPLWVLPNIRVRIVTERLGSRYFKEKAIVVDVTPKGATLQLANGTVLDRVPERYLETALPKTSHHSAAPVIVLARGTKYHAKGRLLERNSRTGVVQFAEDMDVMTLSLDDIAEWCGSLDGDME